MIDAVFANAFPEPSETPEHNEGTVAIEAMPEAVRPIRKPRNVKQSSGQMPVQCQKESLLEELEVAFRNVAGTASEALKLFRPADLRDDPEAVKSFNALVGALCRLGQATLHAQGYRDGLESARGTEIQRGKGLPDELVNSIHERLKLL